MAAAAVALRAHFSRGMGQAGRARDGAALARHTCHHRLIFSRRARVVFIVLTREGSWRSSTSALTIAAPARTTGVYLWQTAAEPLSTPLSTTKGGIPPFVISARKPCCAQKFLRTRS